MDTRTLRDRRGGDAPQVRGGGQDRRLRHVRSLRAVRREPQLRRPRPRVRAPRDDGDQPARSRASRAAPHRAGPAARADRDRRGIPCGGRARARRRSNVNALTDTQLRSLRRELALPDLGDRYRLLSRLGRGGMGTVYLGRDSLLNRDVAVKVVEGDRGSTLFAQRLAEEAKVLARLEHPGIVPIHDFGRSPEGLDYYVMKHVAGETFESYCMRDTPLADRLALSLIHIS